MTTAGACTSGSTPPGYGYAIRKGWVIVSPDIAGVLSQLASKSGGSLAGVAAYKQAVPSGAAATALWYANITEVRQTIESAVPWPPGLRQQYDHQYLPLVRPLHSFSGSAGQMGSVQYALFQLNIG